MYMGRPRKQAVRPVESAAAKAQRLALAPLEEVISEQFYMDIRFVRRPKGVICSRNLYPGHVGDLEECIGARGRSFPVKTIFLALGNVSNSLDIFFVGSVSANINIC